MKTPVGVDQRSRHGTKSKSMKDCEKEESQTTDSNLFTLLELDYFTVVTRLAA